MQIYDNNFARAHLIPSADYITSCYQLSNKDEFDMVYQRSKDIQTATKALLSFNPECLEVTLQGPLNNVTEARSSIVMILEQLREQSSLEGGIYPDNVNSSEAFPFYRDFLSDCITQKHNNNDEMPCSVVEGQPKQGTTESSVSKSQDNSISSSPGSKLHRKKQSTPTLWNIQPQSHTVAKLNQCNDIEPDCAYSSCSPAVEKPHGHYPDETFGLGLKKSSSSSSFSSSNSDNESGSEEKILTDPHYSKQVDKALKLGYSYDQVKKVLIKLGPNCCLNDLLRELVEITAKDTVTEDLSSFSNSSDFQGDSFDSSNLAGSGVVDVNASSNLRPIIIDGSNVAMSHGKTVFSCKGIQIVVDWFRKRGHTNIKAVVPSWRKEASRPDSPITDQEILIELEKERIVVFTPARRIQGKRVVCYDDRYVLKMAASMDGIVVSNDVYRDLVRESEEFQKIVDQRLLMYSFADDLFMPPEDPLGRLGPSLDNFLRKTPAEPSPKPQDCPYGKKCTYGNKCRFYHPERGFAPQKSIIDTLKEQADRKRQEIANMSEERGKQPKRKLTRTKSFAPEEPRLMPMTSQTSVVQGPSKRDKPKLVHSKSLGPPSKTSDYLDEPLRKLKEAEVAAALEKISLTPENNSQQEARKQSITPADTRSSTTSPVKTRSSKSPRASPAHLTVPKAEQSEAFCSGHLLLAKKLSDESTDNFFSEHTSSPSSTRTSSPVVPVNKNSDQRPAGKGETQQREEEVASNLTFPPPSSVQHPQTVDNMARLSTMDNIPNLSLYDSGISRNCLYSDSGDSSSSGQRQPSIDSPLIRSPGVFPRSPDSGNYSAFDPISGNFQSYTEYQSRHPVSYKYPNSPPKSGADQMQYTQLHHGLQRAFSSTGNVKTAEDAHQKLSRRGSAFASPQMMGDHPSLNAQNVPFSPGFEFYGLTRQNSTSDPQIHNTGGLPELQSMYPPSSVLSADTGKKYHDQLALFGQQYQSDQTQMLQQQYMQQQRQQQLQQQPQFNTQQYQRLQHHQHQQQPTQLNIQQYQRLLQQQQESLLMSPQAMTKQGMAPWGEPSSHVSLSHRSSLGGSSQMQYFPQQTPVSMQSSSQLQHFPTSMGNQSVMSAGPPPGNPSHVPQMSQYQQPQMMMASPSYMSTSRAMSPQSYMQAYNSSPSNPQSNPLYSRSTSVAPPQSVPQARPLSSGSKTLQENAAILPADPRFSIYFHFSSLFGEEVVRKVMNLNPNVSDPDTLSKLIVSKKAEMGR